MDSENGSFRKIIVFLQLLLIQAGISNGAIREGDVILEGGSGTREGFVKVYLEDDWQTISPEGFDSATAAVVCRRAGFSGEATPSGRLLPSPGPPVLKITCQSGKEASLLECERAVEEASGEGSLFSASYSDWDIWKNYTVAYVQCNEAEAMPLTETVGSGGGSVVVIIILFIVVLIAVILFAVLVHRCILRRATGKLVVQKKADDKDLGQVEMYAEVSRDAGCSRTAESTFTAGEPRYSGAAAPAAADPSLYLSPAADDYGDEYEKPESFNQPATDENTYASMS